MWRKKMMRSYPFVYFQGALRPTAEARVSIACHSLQYGTTCFAGIRGYVRDGKTTVFRLKDHHERLMNAAKIMGYPFHITYEAFHEIIAELVERNEPKTDFYIRPFLFSSDEQLKPSGKGLSFDLAVYLVPLGFFFDPQKGIRLMVSSWRKFSDTSFPTKAKAGGCYLNSFMATNEAHRCGYDEALLMDQEGYIVEASVANLLLVYRDKLLMPDVGQAQLEGITMRTMVDLLRDEGFQISYERIDRSMIYTCQELMLLGTAAQITFAESIDDRPIGDGQPGPFCQWLRGAFQAVLEGRHAKSADWCSLFETVNLEEK
jgi:branched-chain amino acid aminotransferase